MASTRPDEQRQHIVWRDTGAVLQHAVQPVRQRGRRQELQHLRYGVRVLGERDGDTAREQQHEPDQVGCGQGDLGAQGAGEQQPQPGERDRPEGDQQDGQQRVAVRMPSQREPERHDQRDLHDLEQQHRQRLAADEHTTGERRCAEPLQHRVLALEPRADGQAGERR